MTVVPQHLQALTHANDVRKAIAAFKDELRGLGRARSAEAAWKLAGAITNADDTVGASPVGPLLEAVPGMGPRAARRCLIAAQVPNSAARVRDLTERQRKLVAGQLAFWAETRQ